MYSASIQNNTAFFAEAQKDALGINSCLCHLNEWIIDGFQCVCLYWLDL